jgi:hypothetical protein
MPLEGGTQIKDSKEIFIPQHSKVTTQDSMETIIPQDSKVTPKDSRGIFIPRDSKVTTKDSMEIIMPQIKGASCKEIPGIMDLLGKEIIGEVTGIILPPMLETMGKVEILALDNVT